MSIGVDLEKDLLTNMRELSAAEQDEIRIFSAMYINQYEQIKADRIQALENSISEQIKFYGKKKENYETDMKQILENYAKNMDVIIGQYNQYFCAVLKDLQDIQNNQKIAFANEKICIRSKDEVRRVAVEQKIINYEIVIGECKRQLEACKLQLKVKMEEIFPAKDKQLSKGKASFLHKFGNLFSGKSKVENFVIKTSYKEMENLLTTVVEEVKKIEDEMIKNLAIIKDAIAQTQTSFNEMIEG